MLFFLEDSYFASLVVYLFIKDAREMEMKRYKLLRRYLTRFMLRGLSTF